MKVEAKYDEKTERHVLVVSRTQHGIVRASPIDADFVQSGDYAQIRKTAQVLQGLLGEGAYVKRGEERHAGERIPRGDRVAARRGAAGCRRCSATRVWAR